MNTQNTTAIIRLAPYALYRLDEACPAVTILDGRAWITVAGRDVIAAAGQTVALADFEPPALISGLLGRGVTLRLDRPARDGHPAPIEEQPAYVP